MAKTYSFVDLPTPANLTATPVAGGTLVNGVTYYYRIIGTYSGSQNYWYGKSKSSAEVSATADAVNGSISLQFDSPLGENNYYRVFRSTTPGGMLDKNNAMLNIVPSDALLNAAGVVTFVDTGIATKAGNYTLENVDDCHGRLQLGGSTSSDKFSIVDLYNADQAAGWGVVTRLSRNEYKINCHLLKHTGLYWSDSAKTIQFNEGMSGSTDCHFTFGEKYSTGGRTYKGCNIISSSPWLVTFAWGELIAYRTTFAQVDVRTSNLSGMNFSSGIMQDCTVDRVRNFIPNGRTLCTIQNCIFSNFDNLFSSYVPIIDGCRCMGGSRVFQVGNGAVVFARGLVTEGCYGALVINAVTGSLTVVDSLISIPMAGNYSGNDGYRYYDKFSFNLALYENDDTTPIDGATVQIFDKDLVEVASTTTDSNGEIPEQLVTREEGIADQSGGGPTYTYEQKSPYKLIVSKHGYQSYKEFFPMLETAAVVKTLSLLVAKINVDQEQL